MHYNNNEYYQVIQPLRNVHEDIDYTLEAYIEFNSEYVNNNDKIFGIKFLPDSLHLIYQQNERIGAFMVKENNVEQDEKQLGRTKRTEGKTSSQIRSDESRERTQESGATSQAHRVFIIDFGLGFISKRIEDKAVDLHLIKQALEAKHFQNWEDLFNSFSEGYQDYKEAKEVLSRLKKVESRGRYKH